MLPGPDTSRFTLTASTPTGQPVAGASVRIFTMGGQDFSDYFFRGATALTDAQGVFTILVQNVFVPNPYVIKVTKPGYAPYSYQTPALYFGYGEFSATLERTSQGTAGYSLIGYGGGFKSPALPLLIGAESDAGADWELIRFSMTHLDGRTSVAEAQVDPATGTALVDLRSRVRLHARPNLVPDGETLLPDPDFSDFVTVSATSLTDQGELPINVGLAYWVASIIPPPGEDDLSLYGNRRWITLLPEPIIFRGYYFDTMLWLPYLTEGDSGTLIIEYLNGAFEVVGAPVEVPMPVNKQVYRIRLNAQPDAEVMHVRLRVEDETGNRITDVLTCHYRA
ncbi:carboxypeptidase-like regulatory domain-containing protein [Spirosoma sp. KUDC1026]|uniref:carboxypeptidase-like regulatory domain-containing protein n=1 Tax=Spirosoma sp. KUDC1026 TaxID=2745947 RepID=UPI00159BC6D4|nr:carboxypeptidase-like regulatory domain-containing protein [Spirosoma sp. KUDC1026]QKZ15189.1 carboxypeptidase regulatory-like domain-containing protein [Spirosoma sp. KUDC1026]